MFIVHKYLVSYCDTVSQSENSPFQPLITEGTVDISLIKQLTGILITAVIAAVGGLVSGKLIAALGRRSEAYLDDDEEFDA